MKTNNIFPYDSTLFEDVSISLKELDSISKTLIHRGCVKPEDELTWALKALTLTDLTTLAGDDTPSNVSRLCIRSAFPFTQHLLENILEDSLIRDIHTAAVCVYPSRVKDAFQVLDKLGKNIKIAAVATGFPTGQYSLQSRLLEINYAIESGASEIDIVINRTLALQEKWNELYSELTDMRKACGNRAHLKVILAIGELGTMENVYKASMVAMLAGADFIKTSTGKESVNATIPVGLVMINAIQDFKRKCGQTVGLKPAGGVRTVKEAISWMILLKETLGISYLQPELFRFGASGLLDDIERVVKNQVSGNKHKNTLPKSAY